ncbi:MAG TPA: TSUP family transporter [Candidatus Tectomicrobia bacterium]
MGAARGVGAKAGLGPAMMGSGIGLLGGFLLGLITVGLGELMLPRLLAERKSLTPAEIVGSTVLVIFVTSLAAALVRLNGPFLAALSEQRATLVGALLFAGPGVVLGGQLGPMMVRHLNARALRWYVAIILLLVGLLMLWRFTALIAFER